MVTHGTYRNFDLLITPADGDSYATYVIKSPAGEAQSSFPRTATATAERVLKDADRTERQVREAGTELFEALFTSDVEQRFMSSRAIAKSTGAGLRVRLNLAVPELSQVPWEYMYRADERKWLGLLTETPLVRFIPKEGTPAPLRVEPPLRVLVVLPSAEGAARGIDIEEELGVIHEATAELVQSGFLEITPLRNATFSAVQDLLRDTNPHIFHFVGHGMFDPDAGEGSLAFDSKDGRLDFVSGSMLATQLNEYDMIRLVVLNSCRGSRSSATDNLSGAAQTLTAAGIPAVVAMQEEVTDGAAILFARELYRALARGEPVDTAVVRGRLRLAVETQTPRIEWGTPTLYMRSDDGRLFDVPAAGRQQTGLDGDDWDLLMKRLARGGVTPIVGWSMTSPALPSRQEIADAMASESGYPIHDSADLPKVAQYVAVTDDKLAPKEEVAALVRDKTLNDLGDGAVAYQALAELPVPVYLTTNFDDLLHQALSSAGKTPTREVCPWRNPPPESSSPLVAPTPERPLVYHLYGHPSDPASMVLTEDDYFDYVVAVSRHKSIMSTSVTQALSATSLVLLGYHLEDWMFRVLIRGLVAAAEGAARGTSVAVQLPPSEADAKYAEEYLAVLFSATDENRLRVYWGSHTDFALDLRDRWKAHKT